MDTAVVKSVQRSQVYWVSFESDSLTHLFSVTVHAVTDQMSQEGDTLTSSCLFLNTVVLGSCCVRPICSPPQVLRQICFFGRTHSCCPRAAVNWISSILLAKSIASDLLISVSYQASAWIQVTVWYKKSINWYLSCLYKLLLLAWNAGALGSLDTSVTEFTGGSWTLLAKERNWISSHPEWQEWGKNQPWLVELPILQSETYLNVVASTLVNLLTVQRRELFFLTSTDLSNHRN